jgi:15-cis-phytoene desaturase
MSAQTIQEVVDALDRITDEAVRRSDRVGYFAALYRTVTAEVRDSIRRGEFLDGERMERLDVRFANRYLDALAAYRAGGEVTETWRVTFDACNEREPTILQHMYAGLAAHLLLDLGVAAAETAPGPRLADLKGDFDHINDIVGRLMRQVDKTIGSVSPWIGVIDHWAGFEYAGLNRLGISVARDLAWSSATKLAPLDPAARARAVVTLDRRAAFVARALLRPSVGFRLVAKLIRMREKSDVAAVIRALRGPAPESVPRANKRVAVLGGGIGGLTAAHELAVRGFDVDVYEESTAVGGKARSQSIAGTGTAGRKDLPGEHGFRFFPSFYRHVIDTMERIPVPPAPGSASTSPSSVAARLRRSDEMAMAEVNGTYVFARHPPRELGDFFRITDTVRAFFAQSKVREEDVARFAHAMLRFMVSCDERRLAEYEKISFWDYVGGDHCSPSFQKYLRTPRFMVAMDPRHGSARTVATKAIQILADFFRNGTRTDGVLDGPTTERWLEPWRRGLEARGVTFHFGAKTEELLLAGTRIDGARVQGAVVRADHYVLALPLDRVQAVVSDALAAADPALAGIRELRDATSWMVGAQFYFSEPLAICKGHVAFPDSPWALSSVSQGQFWRDGTAPYGAGNVEDILSVDISDWDSPAPRLGKAARACTREQVLDEVWAQLRDSLGAKLDPAKLVARHLDDNVVFPAGAPAENTTPLLVHPPGSWFHRPGADLAIENLFLASDYVKTNTDLATMEGANEAARRAVNAILETERSAAAPCAIWSMDDGLGPLVAAAKVLDRDLFLVESFAPPELTRSAGALAVLRAAPPATLDALADIEETIVRALRLIRRP